MDITDWWQRLPTATRDWLIANNGDVLKGEVIEDITRSGGVVTTDAWWVDSKSGPSGFYLSDAAIDWVEETANDETTSR